MDALDSYSSASGVVRAFAILRARYQLQPVAFVSQTESDELWRQISLRRPIGPNVFQHLRILIEHCIRSKEPGCLASINGGPTDLSPAWRSALRDAMTNLEDWRNPQILFPAPRRESWPNSPEAEIQFEACDGEGASGPYRRVLACLEEYGEHRFAVPDFDPWNLTHMSPPAPDAPSHMRHPCSLPKPPSCDGVPLNELSDVIQGIRTWSIGSNYYFVPRDTWRPENVEKPNWRNWRAFERGRIPGNDHEGPVDYNGSPWWWDEAHRHWDVQLRSGGYWSISHTGRLITKHE